MIKVAPEDLPLIPTLLGVTPDSAERGLGRIGDLARTKLVTLAKQRLFSSQVDYIAGIQQPRVFTDDRGVPTMELTLRGAFPNMVENGAGSFDLRTTLLNPSAKKRPGTKGVRRSKKGFLYRAIPFRRMGPQASGKNAAALGAAESASGKRDSSLAFRGGKSAAEALAMGRAVQRAARKLAPTVGVPGSKVKYGGRLGAGVGGSAPLRGRHKTDLYEGTIREEKVYEKATQSQLMTFRMISTNPNTFREDADGGAPERNWVHPGITARRLIPATADYVQTVLARKWLGDL